jgi:hypothetical protein
MSFFTPFAFVKRASAGATGLAISQTDLAMWYDVGESGGYSGGDTINNLATAGGRNSADVGNTASSVRTYNTSGHYISFSTTGGGTGNVYFDTAALPIGNDGYTMWAFLRKTSTNMNCQFFTANNYPVSKGTNLLVDTGNRAGVRFETGAGFPSIWPTIGGGFPVTNTWYFIYGDYADGADLRITVNGTTYQNGNDGYNTPYTPATGDNGTTIGVTDGGQTQAFDLGACGFYTKKQTDAQMTAIKSAYNNAGYYV